MLYSTSRSTLCVYPEKYGMVVVCLGWSRNSDADSGRSGAKSCTMSHNDRTLGTVTDLCQVITHHARAQMNFSSRRLKIISEPSSRPRDTGALTRTNDVKL
jgi:hypothetical protein